MIFQKSTDSGSAKFPRIILSVLLSVLSLVLTAAILVIILLGSSFGGHGTQQSHGSLSLLDKFDVYVTNMISTALDGIIQVDKVYILSDSDQVAPEPDEDNFGTTDDPSSLQGLINKVYHRLNGEEVLFSTDMTILEGSKVYYYLDDTIAALTWKQPIRDVVYTFSEIKIEHPSQFRRFLAEGKYGSDKQYRTSQMASSVNAVVASAGDFYKYRQIGLVVYNGEVERYYGDYLDNCFIDDQGDLIFVRANELSGRDDLQKLVADRNIRFSLSFGPILIEDGKNCVPWSYTIGEINGNHARAALCQLGPLHYLLVTVNNEGIYVNFPTLHSFADVLVELGINKAYTLDGGQTATVVMHDQVINCVSYGSERYISDIIYFATAIPETE